MKRKKNKGCPRQGVKPESFTQPHPNQTDLNIPDFLEPPRVALPIELAGTMGRLVWAIYIAIGGLLCVVGDMR